MNTSVHIAHRNDFMREGLRTILHENGLTITGTSGCCHQIYDVIASQSPNVVVIDAQMVREECLPSGGLERLGVNSVITTSDPTSFELAQVIAAGATGYVTDTNSKDLLVAIETASAETHPIQLDTLRVVCETITKHDLFAKDRRVKSLTSAEVRVLRLLSQGLTNREMAEHLNVSINTVKTHLRHSYAKLSLTDRIQAALWAMRHLHADSRNRVGKIHPQG